MQQILRDIQVLAFKCKWSLSCQIYPLADLPCQYLLFSPLIDESPTLVLCPAQRFFEAGFGWQPLRLVAGQPPPSRHQEPGTSRPFLSNQSASLCPPPPSTSNYKQLTLPTFPLTNGRNRRVDLISGNSLLSTFAAPYPQSTATSPP